MKVDIEKVKALCKRKRTTLSAALREAGVSRNAFYSLARKKSVIPGSIEALAKELEVPVLDVLTESTDPIERMKAIAEEASRLALEHPGADWDNLRHTLMSLDEEPVDRLRRALLRGRQVNLRRP